MDKANRQIFIDAFLEVVGPVHNTSDKHELDDVAENHLETLTTIRSGYFLLQDLPEISLQAARRTAAVYLQQQVKDLKVAWQETAAEFHSQRYWGFKTQAEKPKVEKKKNEMAGFLWTVFQAAIVMKLVILYFGVNAANLDSDAHYIGLGIAIFIAFASLLFFAYRKSKTYKD